MQNERYLEIAVELGDLLLERSEKGTSGIWWVTMGLGREDGVVKGVSEVLYHGNAGIAWFLLELARVSKLERFWDAAEKSLFWVSQFCDRNTPFAFSGLFTGRSGVCLPLLKMAEYSRNSVWLDRADKIGKSLDGDNDANGNDLLAGRAGLIIAFLALHQSTGDDSYSKKAARLGFKIAKNAYSDARGWQWDRSSKNRDGLCGLAHGAAGIALSFLELGHYFNEPGWYQFAHQALSYESAGFHSKLGWPDYRYTGFVDDERERYLEAFATGNLGIFNEVTYMNAWCHGAPGIGYSLARAYEYTGRDHYRLLLENAIRLMTPILRNHSSSLFTLCHGLCGMADFFIEASKIFEDFSLFHIPEQVGSAAIDHWVNHGYFISGFGPERGDDPSLMMGYAGIGHFFLRLYAPQKSELLLAPKVNHHKVHSLSEDEFLPEMEAHSQVLRKSFGLSVAIMEQETPCLLREILMKKSEKVFSVFEQFFEEEKLEKLSDKLQDAIKKDYTRLIYRTRNNNPFLLDTMYRLMKSIAEQYRHIENETFMNIVLIKNLNLEILNSSDAYIFMAGPISIAEQKLQPLLHRVLNEFSRPKTVKVAVKKILETLPQTGKQNLQAIVLEQVRLAVLNCLLHEPKYGFSNL